MLLKDMTLESAYHSHAVTHVVYCVPLSRGGCFVLSRRGVNRAGADPPAFRCSVRVRSAAASADCCCEGPCGFGELVKAKVVSFEIIMAVKISYRVVS
jgi:hypothetical protein